MRYLMLIFCAGCFDYNGLSNGIPRGNEGVDGSTDGSDFADGGADLFQVSGQDLAQSDALTVLAATCQDIRDANPSATDGNYTLYVGKNAAKPWTAYCRDMAGQPKEYLSLQMISVNQNFSQYTASAHSPGTNVRTSYQRLRIDPAQLLIDVSDKTYTTSSGSLMHGGNTLVTSMPYAVAMDCTVANSMTGVANVDLRGTPFHLTENNFVGGGSMFAGSANFTNSDQTVNLAGGGFCGWWAAGIYTMSSGPLGIAGFQLALVYP